MENTRYKILLIEDDKLDQMAFERVVKDEKLPYDYMIAGSVSETQSILSSEQFDVIIADYELGDGTSFDILDLVKNSPIIFVTGTGNEEIAVKAWRAGAYDYLTKDVDRNYLKAVPITIANAITQNKAKEEIHRLSHAIEQSPSTVVITDVRGDIEYVNPKFTQMTGYTLEEVRGKNLRILESGEQTPEVHKELWETITSGREWRGEFHNKKKDSGLYWESASISAITNSEGTITGFLKVAEDITERKKAEEQLRKTEEKYRMQFEGALDAIFVADAETGIITDCNPAATRLVGREKSELVGQHQRILHPSAKKSEEGFSRTFKQHLEEKQGQVLETQVITKNGEIKDVAIKASLLEVRGKKIIQGIFRDITEHKQLQEMLDRKQKNLEAIFDAAPVGMMLVDENMIVKRVNNVIRQMVHGEYSQIINQSIGGALDCLNSTHNEKGCGYSPACAACPLRKMVKNVLDSGECIHEVEIQPTLKVDNKEITPWLCISAQPATIDNSKHVVVAINDITNRKEAEEKLKEAMEVKSQFISTVSHELRTPLASMKEGIAILLDGIAGEINDEQRNFLNIAKRNVDRLALLINDVLDFQKLEAGKMRLNIQENDINEVIGEVQKTMFPSANKKGIDILLELDDNLPKARFDRDKIIQVLTNLINNAIKFTEQGQVSVCVRQQDEELIIRVSDTGMGIPKDALTKIFDRFYRVHRPGKQIQGTGLGLAIVKKIVLMHGGRIDVESEVDKGTTFTVFLPLAAKPVPEVPSAEMDEFLENSLVNNQACKK